MRRQLKAESWVSVAVNNHRMVKKGSGKEEKSENWIWQVEECSVIRNILLVFVLALDCHRRRCHLFVHYIAWNVKFVKCEAIVAVDETFLSFNARGFTSLDASGENSFTTFLCRAREWKLKDEEDKSKLHQKRFYDRKVSPEFNSFLLRCAVFVHISSREVESLVVKNESR